MSSLPPTNPHGLCAYGARRFQFPGSAQWHHMYTDMWPTTTVITHHVNIGPWKLYHCACAHCIVPGVHPLLLFKYLRDPSVHPHAPSEWTALLSFCLCCFRRYNRSAILTEQFDNVQLETQFLVWLPGGFVENPLPSPEHNVPVISNADLTICISAEMLCHD